MATHSGILPDKCHGQRSVAGYSPLGSKKSDTTVQLTHAYVCNQIMFIGDFLFSCSVMSDSFDPIDGSLSCFPVLQCLLEFAQIHYHQVNDTIQQSHPLSLPSAPALNLS